MTPKNPTKLFPLIITTNLAKNKEFYVERSGFRVVFDMPNYLHVAYGEADGPELSFMLPDAFPGGQVYPSPLCAEPIVSFKSLPCSLDVAS
jgi:catechol 2,3-dioxygenase-like lactoylglutathione lyase family enzyme